MPTKTKRHVIISTVAPSPTCNTIDVGGEHDIWRKCPHCYAMLDSKRGENWEWSRHKVWRIIHEWADTRKPEKEPGEFGSYTFWVRVLRSLDQYKGDFTWPEE